MIASLLAASSLATFTAFVVVDDGIPEPLAGARGDAQRGAALAADRTRSFCLLCHAAPLAGVPRALQGTVSTDLAGAGARWSEAQLRLRLVDARRLNPATSMPSFHVPPPDEAAQRVAPAWQGRPLLAAGEIEDLVAWLLSLKSPLTDPPKEPR